jgi:hypothetical protein
MSNSRFSDYEPKQDLNLKFRYFTHPKHDAIDTVELTEGG